MKISRHKQDHRYEYLCTGCLKQVTVYKRIDEDAPLCECGSKLQRVYSPLEWAGNPYERLKETKHTQFRAYQRRKKAEQKVGRRLPKSKEEETGIYAANRTKKLYEREDKVKRNYTQVVKIPKQHALNGDRK